MKLLITSPSISSYLIPLKERVASSFFAFRPYQAFTTENFSSPFNSRKIKQFFKNSPYIPLIVVFAIVLLIAFFAIKNVLSKQTTPAKVSNTADPRIAIAKPRLIQSINKEFSFPIKDQNQKQVSTIKYEVQGAEIRDQIVVRGEKATAVQGKEFLIINLKITNNYTKSINLNTRDYIRLILGNSTDRLAPSIHNDPVEVQAISTNYTRVGFAIDETQKNMTLQVGEIDGSKQFIKLQL